MGEIVDDLVARVYLSRREDPTDRRAKRIYLTQKGRDTARASRIALLEVERRISETLGTDTYQEMRRNLAGNLRNKSIEGASKEVARESGPAQNPLFGAR